MRFAGRPGSLDLAAWAEDPQALEESFRGVRIPLPAGDS
jgi:hypothetical protein